MRLGPVAFVLAIATATPFALAQVPSTRGAASLGELRAAAEKGEAKAQFNLGLMYDNGQGVPQDYNEAAKWYTKAAEQGFPAAEYNLAGMYEDGRGVPLDYKEAVKW
jgi:TPR repeat protein